jgi:putative membrane protein
VFLVSLVVGALRAPVAEIGGREGIGWTTGVVTEFALVGLVGAILLVVLDRYAVDVEVDVDVDVDLEPGDGGDVDAES